MLYSNYRRSSLFWKGINRNAMIVQAKHNENEAIALAGIERIQAKYAELKAR